MVNKISKIISVKTVIVCIILGVVIGLTVYKDNNINPTDESSSGHDIMVTDQGGESHISSPGYGVVADNQLAVEIGMQILENGGNAVDAAVAVSYALGVVTPYNSGIGGGGEMIVCPADGTSPVYYDYISVSPSNTSGLIAVPGFVKGMEAVHNDFGIMSMDQLLDPSMKIAKDGLKVSPLLAKIFFSSASKIDKSYGDIPAPGEVLKQPGLAKTLEEIKKYGSDAFYLGDIAAKIANSNNGITLKDLAAYKVIKGEPVKGSFYGYDVYSSAPPLGGTTLIQILALAETLQLDKYKLNSAEYMTLLSKIIAVTYHDRLNKICDPDYFTVDLQKLTSAEYISALAKQISDDTQDLNRLEINESPADINDMENTTHIVVVDKSGMMVSVTNTLTNWFGSGKYVEGFFLNSSMKDFSQNVSSINYAQSGKRARSFISPAVLVKNGKPVIGIGSPGAKRIPMVITEVLMAMIKYDIPVQSAVSAPRFYSDKNIIYIENLFKYDFTTKDLRNKGYSIIKYDNPIYYGGINTLVVDYDKQTITGGADPRREAYCITLPNDKYIQK